MPLIHSEPSSNRSLSRIGIIEQGILPVARQGFFLHNGASSVYFPFKATLTAHFVCLLRYIGLFDLKERG